MSTPPPPEAAGINQPSRNFLLRHYPPDYFSHIVIDECHRSAWGKWRSVLERNPAAAKIGLTATPRKLETPRPREAKATPPRRRKTAPSPPTTSPTSASRVYEYTMAQAMDDGYLAACEVITASVDIDRDGLSIDQVMALNPTDARTGPAPHPRPGRAAVLRR